MTSHNTNNNSINVAILLSLLSMFSFQMRAFAAQSREAIDMEIYERVQAWEDSVGRANPRKHPRYLGFDVQFAAHVSQLSSKLDKMNGSRMTYTGGSVGGMLANDLTKVKANVGFYYSLPNMPHTVESFQASTSMSVYLLRISKIEYHTLEPYAVVGITQQFNKYYGTYLLPEGQPYNHSQGDQPLMGKVGLTQLTIGAGIEWQLESEERQFLHFFSEATYGLPIMCNASSMLFSDTQTTKQLCITLGLGFGMFKD